MSCLTSGRSPQDVSHHKPGSLSRLETQYFCVVELGETAVIGICKIATNRFLLRHLRNIMAVVKTISLINIQFK